MDFGFQTHGFHQNGSWRPFLESPETLQAIFGCHNSRCISRMERIYVIKLHRHVSFSWLENMLKGRLSKTSVWQFHKWLSGSEKFSGLSRNGPLDSIDTGFQVLDSGFQSHPLAGFQNPDCFTLGEKGDSRMKPAVCRSSCLECKSKL